MKQIREWGKNNADKLIDNVAIEFVLCPDVASIWPLQKAFLEVSCFRSHWDVASSEFFCVSSYFNEGKHSLYFVLFSQRLRRRPIAPFINHYNWNTCIVLNQGINFLLIYFERTS